MRGVRDNILHVATSYFMQKAVKHKRPRIVFDDSPAGCVLWQTTRVRIFRAPRTFFKTREAATSYGTLSENLLTTGCGLDAMKCISMLYSEFLRKELLQKFSVYILFMVNIAGS